MDPSVHPEPVTKPFHTIILDASPLLLNTPSISTLLANGHTLVTTPSVLGEMRGEEARIRIETLYKPFLNLRSPKPETIKLIKEFARKTGDGAVLSQTDYDILAIAYDLECERNGGNWRLRSTPGQKRVNGSPPEKSVQSTTLEEENKAQSLDRVQIPTKLEDEKPESPVTPDTTTAEVNDENTSYSELPAIATTESSIDPTVEQLHSSDNAATSLDDHITNITEQIKDFSSALEEDSSSDSDGWITPSNLKKYQAKDESPNSATKSEAKTLQVATMTGDFAMQNVLLQMNLNLLSTKTCKRITQIKQFILRCHACFLTTKDMTKQFCPRCGKPTLTRVTCTTNDKGEVKLHLKSNMQWNNRGNVFSIPKPSSSTSNQKWQGPKQGGGQGGWGNDLILAEDQKEYVRAMSSMKRTKQKDLMDDDFLPSILSGDRDRSSGRVRVGAGRNVNSRKR